MSRSYKRSPRAKDKNNKYMKHLSNVIVRKTKISDAIKNGKYYKKLYCSYDICDYNVRWTKEEALETYHDPYTPLLKQFTSEEECLNYHRKCTRQK